MVFNDMHIMEHEFKALIEHTNCLHKKPLESLYLSCAFNESTLVQLGTGVLFLIIGIQFLSSSNILPMKYQWLLFPLKLAT